MSNTPRSVPSNDGVRLGETDMCPNRCVSFSATTFSVNGTSSLSRPVPSTFVKRSGSKLELDGAEFRAVGPNSEQTHLR